jgi:hypothetical protein
MLFVVGMLCISQGCCVLCKVMCYCWLNTAFVQLGNMVLGRADVDGAPSHHFPALAKAQCTACVVQLTPSAAVGAHNDKKHKRFHKDFQIVLSFSAGNGNGTNTSMALGDGGERASESRSHRPSPGRASDRSSRPFEVEGNTTVSSQGMRGPVPRSR